MVQNYDSTVVKQELRSFGVLHISHDFCRLAVKLDVRVGLTDANGPLVADGCEHRLPV